MSTPQIQGWVVVIGLLITVAHGLGVISPLLAQQGSPTLVIISPPTGTVVRPGETLTVTVIASPAAAFDEIIIVGENPLGFSDVIQTPPFQFSLSIPDDINPRQYQLTAFGHIANGPQVESPAISISVEPPSPPPQITVEPTPLGFSFVGEQKSLQVIGTMPDGTSVDLTESTTTVYSSRNPEVATVSTTGVVTATGVGSTEIIVNQSITVPVSVPVTIRGDLDGDGDVDTDDLNLLLDELNTTATGPFDARDLNGDGIINALDARVLVTLCSRPRCATH